MFGKFFSRSFTNFPFYISFTNPNIPVIGIFLKKKFQLVKYCFIKISVTSLIVNFQYLDWVKILVLSVHIADIE